MKIYGLVVGLILSSGVSVTFLTWVLWSAPSANTDSTDQHKKCSVKENPCCNQIKKKIPESKAEMEASAGVKPNKSQVTDCNNSERSLFQVVMELQNSLLLKTRSILNVEKSCRDGEEWLEGEVQKPEYWEVSEEIEEQEYPGYDTLVELYVDGSMEAGGDIACEDPSSQIRVNARSTPDTSCNLNNIKSLFAIDTVLQNSYEPCDEQNLFGNLRKHLHLPPNLMAESSLAYISTYKPTVKCIFKLPEFLNYQTKITLFSISLLLQECENEVKSLNFEKLCSAKERYALFGVNYPITNILLNFQDPYFATNTEICTLEITGIQRQYMQVNLLLICDCWSAFKRKSTFCNSNDKISDKSTSAVEHLSLLIKPLQHDYLSDENLGRLKKVGVAKIGEKHHCKISTEVVNTVSSLCKVVSHNTFTQEIKLKVCYLLNRHFCSKNKEDFSLKSASSLIAVLVDYLSKLDKESKVKQNGPK